MATFMPYKILSTQLDTLPISEGQFIITTDTQLCYLDISATERVLVNEDSIEKIEEVANDLTNYYTKTELTPITTTRIDELWDATIAQSVIG